MFLCLRNCHLNSNLNNSNSIIFFSKFCEQKDAIRFVYIECTRGQTNFFSVVYDNFFFHIKLQSIFNINFFVKIVKKKIECVQSIYQRKLCINFFVVVACSLFNFIIMMKLARCIDE
jgi:hypothetical protein